MATHSVQPVAMSVSVEGVDEVTIGLGPPQCSTMSISKKPGGGSRQSANVRTGMLRRMAEPTPLRRLRCPSMCARAAASTRSMVAALTCKTLVLTTGSRSRWPCRSIASTSIGINAFSRLPQTRSAASHSTVSACRTASSYSDCAAAAPFRGDLLSQYPDGVFAVVARERHELVEDLDLRLLPLRSRYRARSASINSLRVVMLIRLVTLCCSRRTIRRVASYVRQRVSHSPSRARCARPPRPR